MAKMTHHKIWAIVGALFGLAIGTPLLYIVLDGFGSAHGWWQAGPAGQALADYMDQILNGMLRSVGKLFELTGLSEDNAKTGAAITLLILSLLILALLMQSWSAKIKRDIARLRDFFSE
ncbi:hypothetical protein HYW60_02730 [Candidatus Kaiserbacteria bacterium]|nr:hypothetical protein [Candidatus Kaiserbacteria bacterium]